MMKKILITGGTGLVGKHLKRKLEAKNYDVVILTRNPTLNKEFKWNITEEYIDETAFKGVTHIIHLAGAGIADKRWTNKRKKELINSRVESANLLLKKVKEFKVNLKGFVSASGIGYYGAITSDKIFTEKDEPENDFISKICVEWEEAANQFNKLNIPVTILRTGVVLAKNDGALQKMNTPLLLSALGSGNQYMPWIHIEDLCNMYVAAIEEKNYTGVFNAVAPEHQTNKLFTKALGKELSKPISPINAPSFIIKTALGELACILLKGSRVSSKKIEQLGFKFKFSTLERALKNL